VKIDHINIAAPYELLLQVKDFYCAALELEDGPRPDFGVRGFWLYGDGSPIIHLLESDAHFASEKQHYLDHVAFEAKDITAYVARLEAIDVEYTRSHRPEFNFSQVFCKDPCGNGVEANFFG